jgi:hypothetical protein
VTDVVAAAAGALGRPLEDLGALGGSPRSGVHRARDGAGTVVLKSYAGGSWISWARERVGLGVAGGLGLAPRLLAVGADPPLVVMEDLGSATDVAGLLLGSDPHAANDALVAWARTLGRLHAHTHADREATRQAFAEAEDSVAGRGQGDSFNLGVVGGLEDVTRRWAGIADELGLSGIPDVDALAARLTDPEHHALSPADTCPDNNMLTAEGCRLIDFEWAEVRHPAWDASYLAVPWPTCWCSWRIPEASAVRALDAYREEAAQGIPYVAGDEFTADLEAARVCWALASVSWSLTTALRQDEQPHPASPGTRPRMQYRLALVAESGTAAADLAGQVLEHTRREWGDLVLPLAPAYR